MKARRYFAFLSLLLLAIALCTDFVGAQTQLKINDVMLEQTVTATNYKQYSLESIEPLSESEFLYFVLTPIAGDADLFVGHQFPATKHNSIWSSTSAGGDAITIGVNDGNYTTGPYYIGVYGHSDTQFTILAYRTNGSVWMTDGIPQMAVSEEGTYSYFHFYTDVRGFTISVTPLFGDADIYVSATTDKPSSSDYTWRGARSGYDIVTVPDTDDDFVANTTYFVAIHGYRRTQYSIQFVLSGSMALLADAVPHAFQVDYNRYGYYVFKLLTTRDITITATSMTMTSDPDIYVSRTTPNPTSSDYTWRSIDYGSDTVEIPTTDEDWGLGYYYIGVRAAGLFAATYTLTASTQQAPVLLNPGVPFHSAISMAGRIAQFKYYNSYADSTIIITAPTSSGTVELYVSRSMQPGPNNYEVKSNSEGGVAIARVHNNLRIGWYYIGVLGVTPANYSITAENQISYVTLIPGEISFGHSIPEDHYKYFIFDNADPTADITISVRTALGDADIYISSTTTTPNSEDYEYRSIRDEMDSITIHADSAPTAKRFYIGVQAYDDDAIFSIIAYLSNQTSIVYDGIPTPGVVTYKQYIYYKFILPQSASLTFNLDVPTGYVHDADLYVSTVQEKPNNLDYEWASRSFASDSISIENAAPAVYYIGVYGATSRVNSSYILTVSTVFQYLAAGSTVEGFVRAGHYMYYALPVGQRDNEVSLGVTLVHGATELLANTNSTRPTKDSAGHINRRWPGNVLHLTSNTTADYKHGLWMIAVYGVEDSHFFMGSYTTNRKATLNHGEPRVGLATQEENGAALFRFSVRALGMDHPREDYYLSIRMLEGIGSFFVDQNVEFPSQDAYTWNVPNVRFDYVLRMEKENLVHGYVNIGAYVTGFGSHRAKFELTVFNQYESRYLTQTRTLDFQETSRHTPAFFTIATHQQSSTVKIDIDSCDGNKLSPVVYASTHFKRPNPHNASHYEFVSSPSVNYEAAFSQVLTLPSSAVKPNTPYYLTIYPAAGEPASAATFSIYGTTGVDNRPIPGNGGLLTKTGEVGASHVNIRFTAASGLHGPFQYWVYRKQLTKAEASAIDTINMRTVCGIEANGRYDGRVTHQSSSELRYNFTITDGQHYLINVIVGDAYGQLASYAPLLITDENLRLGVPEYAASVSANNITYFKFVATPEAMADQNRLVFATTPLGGDADLYVSLDALPTKDDHHMAGTTIGGDVVSIISSSPYWSTSGTYYLGVYGYTQSMFSVVAYTVPATVVQLLDGEPQAAQTLAGEYVQFSYYHEGSSSFRISLTPMSGDPDIFVSTAPNPTRETSMWSSVRIGVELVDIDNTHTEFKANATYYISVLGFRASAFSMVVKKEASTATLSEGVIQAGKAGRTVYQFYRFPLVYTADLSISVVALSGDPDLFISRTNPRPTVGNCDYSSRASGSDSYTIPNAAPGWIYVGILGFTDSVYELVARTSFAATQLTIGAPVYVSSPLGTWNYFVFHQADGAQADITFIATTTVGGVEMFSSQLISRPSDQPDKFDRRSITIGSTTSIYYDAPSANGNYYLGVLSKTAVSNYTITVQSSQSVTVLMEGQIMFFNEVPKHAYRYFSFLIADRREGRLTISLRSDSGDADIYASIDTIPTKDNATYSSMRSAAAEYIEIDLSTVPAGGSTVYIAVYGYSAARFSIMAYYSSTVITLLEGTPIADSVARHQYRQYKYYSPSGAASLTFTLTVADAVTTRNDADIYVSRSANPSKLQYEWRSINVGSDLVQIPSAAAGWYYVAVYGETNASYVLTASVEMEYLLANANPQISFVSNTRFKYYQTTVTAATHQALISLTLINGATKLYARPGTVRPGPTFNASDFNYASSTWPGNTLFISSPSDEPLPTGEWTIAVVAHSDSDFYLSFVTARGRLSPSVPTLVEAVAGKPSPVFTYPVTVNPVTNPYADLRVNVRTIGLNSAPGIVYMSQTSTTPDASSAQWTLSVSLHSTGLLVIPNSELRGGNLYIAFAANQTVSNARSSSSTMEISISAIADPVYITQNQPQELILPQNTPVKRYHFTTLSSSRAQTLVIQMDSCDAVPPRQFYVSSTTKHPNSTSAEFSSHSKGTFSEVIYSNGVQPNAVYYGASDLVDTSKSQSVVSVYITTTQDSRPKLPEKTEPVKLTRQDVSNGVYSVLFELPPAKSEDVHQYMLYRFGVQSASAVNASVNMVTVCGIMRNGAHVDTVHRETSIPLNIGFRADNLDVEQSYIFAVIAVNSRGLMTAYPPFSVSRPEVGGGGVFGIILLILVILVVSYFAVGSAYNFFIRKRRGIEILPNHTLWSRAGQATYRGVRYIMTCGKDLTYERFEGDLSVNRDHRMTVIHSEDRDDDDHDEHPREYTVGPGKRTGQSATDNPFERSQYGALD